MSVVYSIRWRLVFLDGRTLEELPSGSTIIERWPNPIELHLIDLAGKVVQGVPIPPGHKPIFYRQRSIAQRPNGEFRDTELDATVFGYGREQGSQMDCKLWLWRKGQAFDCPQEHFAQGAIEMQLQA